MRILTVSESGTQGYQGSFRGERMGSDSEGPGRAKLSLGGRRLGIGFVGGSTVGQDDCGGGGEGGEEDCECAD